MTDWAAHHARLVSARTSHAPRTTVKVIPPGERSSRSRGTLKHPPLGATLDQRARSPHVHLIRWTSCLRETAPKAPLKRVKMAESWEFPPARLYLDDIERISTLFQRFSENVTIQLDGYLLTTVHDASELTAVETRDLEIAANRGSLRAAFTSHWGRFIFEASD